MTGTKLAKQSRRSFLLHSAAAAGGLVIGLHLPSRRNPALAAAATAAPPSAVDPNAFIRIAPDNTVTFLIKHAEFGQGTYTGLATLLAEELDADWAQIRIEAAPANAALYGSAAFGGMQMTGGSTSMMVSYLPMRQAGAAARAMLVQAAATAWNVAPESITVAKGVLRHKPTGRTATFGEFAEKAAALTPPAAPALKAPKSFTLIGSKTLRRVDSPEKTDGTAAFGIDLKLPDQVVALVKRPTLFGATARSIDAHAAKAIPGVIDVVKVSTGVAVVGRDYWSAHLGREALKVTWDTRKAETRSSDAIMADLKKASAGPAVVARKDGDAAGAIAGAAKTLNAAFEFPFLAHATMEPMSCVVKLSQDGLEAWYGAQTQTLDQIHIAKAAGLKPEQVKIHTLYAGGSFGRRGSPQTEYVVDAVLVAKALKGRHPVKLIWTREDDITGGFYRPAYYHTLSAGLDASGALTGWTHRIVGQSVVEGSAFESMIKDGVDPSTVQGAFDMPYAIPNQTIDHVLTRSPVPVWSWRAVGSTHTGYSTEVFLDEVAEAAGADPYKFRRALLDNAPRHRAVLDLAARKAGWGRRMAKGSGRGIALHQWFGTVVAQVAEVSVDAKGGLKVLRVVCAIDCGTAVNPDVIAAQMEGGIGFGLGAVMHGAITLKNGVVEQSNFDGYRVLRLDEMPKVEVHIVPSSEPPTGVGEAAVPPIGPAVANAIHAATGQRIRVLPFEGSLQAPA